VRVFLRSCCARAKLKEKELPTTAKQLQALQKILINKVDSKLSHGNRFLQPGNHRDSRSISQKEWVHMPPLDSAHRRAKLVVKAGGFVIDIYHSQMVFYLSKIQLRTVRKDAPLLSFVRK